MIILADDDGMVYASEAQIAGFARLGRDQYCTDDFRGFTELVDAGELEVIDSDDGHITMKLLRYS